MEKTILLIGGTSQIGNFIIPLLLEKEYKVIALSRNEIKSNKTNIEWIKYDIIKDKDTIIFNATFLINLANINIMKYLIPNIKQLKRIISFSSTSVVTKLNSHVQEERDLIKSLLEGEEFIKSLSHKKNNIFYTIFRPTLIYGANKDKNISFIKKFIQKYHFFPIIGNGKAYRQPVHAKDLALACILALNNKNTYNKTYNLSGGETLTYYEMVKKIFIHLNKKIIIVRIPKFLFKLFVKIFSLFPPYKHLSTGMVDRLTSDLCFSCKEAEKDFGYNPSNFKL